MTQWWGFIPVELTPQWACVTAWIYMPWWGPITVELTPSWGPVTTHIYYSQWEWPNDGVLVQLNWPHLGVVLQPEFICHNGDLLQFNWPHIGVILLTPVTTRPHLGVVDLLACLLALGRPNCPALLSLGWHFEVHKAKLKTFREKLWFLVE